MHEISAEQPFPLRQLFRKRFLPLAAAFLGISILLIGFTAQNVVQSIYLELAQRRAQTIARAIEDGAPNAWRLLMAGKTATELSYIPDSDKLIQAFGDEVKELGLPELKVYDLERKVLFATHADEIGTTENGAALRSVVRDSNPEIVTKNLPDGRQQYELYVPVFDGAGNLRTVFELYEPVGYLDTIFTRAAMPSIAVPTALLLALFVLLDRLVRRAQNNIDDRTTALNALRRRLESFVSSTAADAARHEETIASQKLTTTLFFSDIRDFTGYAEQNPPEKVVAFLNHLMTLQVDIIRAHGGDVDKMIGDAVLARFDGKDGHRRAICAARDILQTASLRNLPRRLGIGIYKGPVISGAIGPENRRDFTVIGDSVNIASRLCSAAHGQEIVIDADLADGHFGPIEEIFVKGRAASLAVRRGALDDPAANRPRETTTR